MGLAAHRIIPKCKIAHLSLFDIKNNEKSNIEPYNC